ncbi:MAG: protein kinase, partial [Acidobacteriota bacterium]|nr:protein kinase [Acidobacteriota bacterium]
MLSPNTLLQNRYLIKRTIAKGGMGMVYEAEAIHLGRKPVAVKETLFDEDWLREQFQREAVVLANLSHPVLPRVTDHFTEGGGQFLVMEFIQGDDLEKLLKKRGAPFEWQQVAEWADRLLDALDYIHTQYPPVIHRDIKPSNLKLTPRGQIVLLDFGLAKNATTPTRPGGSVHAYTKEYAPPEQIKGTGTDARCDLYSLGATLYHLLTNEAPADAKLRDEMMALQMPDPLRPAHLVNRQIPTPLAVVIARAMAVDRERRYSTAAAMREALQHARQSIEEALLEEQRQKAEAARLLAEQQRLAEETRQRAAAEAKRKRREEIERQQREETERRQKEKEEIERKQREQAEQRQKKEVERKQREEAERRQKEKEEAERKQRTEAERKQKEEADRKQREARERDLAEQHSREGETRLRPTPLPVPQPSRNKRLAIFAGLALLALLALGYGMWKASQSGGKPSQLATALTATPTPSPTPSGAQPSPTGEAPKTNEVLLYAQKFAADGSFRLHFTPSHTGYLYIVALDEDNIPITLLTNRHSYQAAQPGNRPNRLTAGTEFVFPRGAPLTLSGDNPTAPLTLIFSPTELKNPPFLDAAALHGLSKDEQRALEALKRQAQ